MAMKKGLTEKLKELKEAALREPVVEIRVPPADPTDDYVRNARRSLSDVENLKAERDALKTECEALRAEVKFLQKANNHIAEERMDCRQQSNDAFYRAGELAATLDGMIAFMEQMRGTIRRARKTADERQQEEAPAPAPLPRERDAYDLNGVPTDLPPQITLEELQTQSMSTVLARVEGVE